MQEAKLPKMTKIMNVLTAFQTAGVGQAIKKNLFTVNWMTSDWSQLPDLPKIHEYKTETDYQPDLFDWQSCYFKTICSSDLIRTSTQ